MEKLNFKVAYVATLILILGFTIPSISDDPELVVDPSSYNFGKVEIGKTSTTYIVGENYGSDSALWIGVRIKPGWNSDFELIVFDLLPKWCAYGDAVWVQINFTPTSEMQVSSILEFYSEPALPKDPPGVVLEVQLSGTGVAAPEPVCPDPVVTLDYDCSTTPEEAGWLIYDPYTNNSTWYNYGDRLVINANHPGGQATFYKLESSLATAEKFAIDANVYIADYLPQSGIMVLNLGFGFSDGIKSTVMWPTFDLDKGQIAINYSVDPYYSEEGVTDWFSANTYRLVVDKSNADPADYAVEVYLNNTLVLTVPYNELTDAPGSLPVVPDEPYLFGFGGNRCKMVWDNIRYEVCGSPPSIPKILDNFDSWVDDGTLSGVGEGQSAENRLNALRNMLTTAGELIDAGEYEAACRQLHDAYLKCDGEPNPPDFIEGESREELAEMIWDLMQELGCEQCLSKRYASEPENETIVLPTEFALEQNRPNPFNPTTTINYTIAKNSHVKLTVYNTLGQVVAILVNGFQTQGSYSVTWNAQHQPSGLYICQLEADGFTTAKKMFLQK